MNTSKSKPARALERAVHTVLRTRLRTHAAQRLLLAYSGGLDSSVLLDLAVGFARENGVPLVAVHVDHGLHSDSPGWARHCVASAAARGVECEVARLDGRPAPGESIEDWARTHRYAELERRAHADTLVLVAQHRDDQVETIVQRIGEGAGPHGLRGMPVERALGEGWLVRPLLGVPRETLEQHASARGLAWLDDPANDDDRFLRNRIGAVPKQALRDTFPRFDENLVRLAAIQDDVAAVLDGVIDKVLADAGFDAYRLPTAALAALEGRGAKLILRRALVRIGATNISHKLLERAIAEVVHARPDATPALRFGGVSLRRYGDGLYFTTEPLPTPLPDAMAWPAANELRLPWGRLSVEPGVPGSGFDAGLLASGRLRVSFRRGGEQCRPHGRGHTHALKKLLQEWRVPPWERGLTPLILVDGRIAAVPGHCVCEGFTAQGANAGVTLHWSSSLGGRFVSNPP